MNETNISYSAISRAAGVSVATVSRCLKQPELVRRDTIRKIFQAIEELGGKAPAITPNLSRRENRILAITPVLNNPFYTDMLQGIHDAATQSGHHVLIVNETLTRNNVSDILKLIDQTNVSGVIIIQKVDTLVLDQLKERIPLVQCSEFNEEEDISYVTIDNLDAYKKLMRYVLSTGKTKIALVNNDPDRYTYARLRLQGYTESLQQCAIPINPDWILTIADASFNAAVSAVSAMLKSDDVPEAILCVSDIMAAAALRACATEGFSVPSDIIVAGFDNVDISLMTTPNITTINQPSGDIASMAFTQLLSLMANPDKPHQQFILETELILRESTDFQMTR